MKRRTISILSPDLSGNALGRAYVLAKLLQDEYDVRVVAHGKGEVWEPIRDDASIEYRSYFQPSFVAFNRYARRTVEQLVDGDLILAVKPLLPSFGLGLYARRLLHKPLLLDIDDWELGFLSDSKYWEARHYRHRWLLATTSPLYTRLLDRAIPRADAVTVSNRFLQDRYGGTWVPHARDALAFRDAPASADATPTAMFLGTARQNKGLDILLQAWRKVDEPSARLRIIGTAPDSPAIQPLLAQADHRVSFEGPVPFAEMPGLLASASVIVIPQQAMAGSVGQLPAKLIDGLAAGRPIISTAVGDIPAWLAHGAGITVPPGDPAALASAIQTVFDHPDQAADMAERGRQRFLQFGSMEAVRPRLHRLVHALIHRQPLPPVERAFAELAATGPAHADCTLCHG